MLQSQQRGAIHMRKLSCVHSTTYTGIKHPLRNLQSRKCFELVAHASQDNTATSAGAATNQHAFSMPRVPAVLYVAKSSFMGVAYLGCNESPTLPRFCADVSLPAES